jgi:hypothetical protein
MPTYTISLPDGRTADVEGPENSEQSAIDYVRKQWEAGAFDTTTPAPQESRKPSVTEALGPYGGVSAYVPAVAELGLEGVSGALGGVAGYGRRLYESATGATEEEARQAGQDVREAMTYDPRLQESQQITDYLGNLVKPVGEAIAPLVEPTARFLETAGEQLISPDLFGETASQTAGEAFRGFPMAASDALGLFGAGKGVKAVSKSALEKPVILKVNGQPTAELDDLLAKKGVVYERLSPAQQAAIPDQIDEVPIVGRQGKELATTAQKESMEEMPQLEYKMQGGKVVPDTAAKEAVDLGFREGGIVAIKSYNRPTIDQMEKMVRKHMAVANNDVALQKFGRPSDIAASETVKRWKAIDSRVDQSIKKLDEIVKGDAGKIPFTGKAIINDILDEINVRVDVGDNGKAVFDFSDSYAAANKKAQAMLKSAYNLSANRGPNPTFADAHLLKKQIDDLVNYNSTLEGGAKSAENALKSFRAQLNDALGVINPDYMEANRILSKSLDLQNDWKKAVGNIDYKNPEALGTVLRRLFGNTNSRVKLQNAIEGLDNWSQELGGTNSTNILGLAKLADDLDKTVSSIPTTSFAAEVGQATKAATADLAFDVATGSPGASSVARAGRSMLRRKPDEKKIMRQKYAALLKLLKEQKEARKAGSKPAPKQPGTEIVPFGPRD